jgi:predicted transcriptional regulator
LATISPVIPSPEAAMSVTIRISAETHKQLRRVARARKQPIGRVVAAALKRLESDDFWDEMEANFERLNADPEAAAAYLAEHREWDVTLLDGLESEPPYYDEQSLQKTSR